MSNKSYTRFYLTLPIILGLLFSAVFLWSLSTTRPVRSHSWESTYPISIIPEQMLLTGDVASRSNCVDASVCSWLDDVPTGTIMLGVNPASPDPDMWRGGSVTAEVFLPNIYTRTVITLKLTWPDQDGKGLHSPLRNRSGEITLDGNNLWFKRTTDLSAFNDYYAVEHEPVLATFVLTQSMTHTLRISVAENMAWDLSQIELTASPYPTLTKGIGYSPFRDCQYPGGQLQPTTQDIREDLLRLFHTSNAIRTYSATGVNAQIPVLANSIGLPIYAGAWLDYPKATMEQDDAEILGLIDLACTTDLQGVIVGNEYYLRHRKDEYRDYLLQRIQEVRNGIKAECDRETPITTAEVDDLTFNWTGDPMIDIVGINPVYQPILDEIDFVMVHTYPFWSELPVDGAAEYTINRYKAMRTLLEQEYPDEDKWIVIGETGWPSGGAPNGQAVPSMANQRKYLLELLPLTEQEDVNFMYFDAFDELWKIEEPGSVGQHWGYSYSDRSAKHSFYGILIQNDLLPPPPPSFPFTYTVFLPSVSKRLSGLRGFPVFTEWPEGPEGPSNFVPSGWMGDENQIGMFECSRIDPHSGEMAIQATFSTGGTAGWGSVAWQYPENNWGDLDDGLNLSWANKVTFWARGENGGEKIRFFMGGIGDEDALYPDSWRPSLSTGFVRLTNRWQQYTINLQFAPPEPNFGQDLSRVIGGFGWATNQCANPSGATFYLDDIVYEYDPDLPPPSMSSPVFPVYTDAAAPDNHYFPDGWMGDASVPGRVSLTECWRDNPHSGQDSMRVDYTNDVIGWAGIYWNHPAGNWGDRPGGYDLTGADRLTFWARSDTPNAKIKIVLGGIGYLAGDQGGDADCTHPLGLYPDSVCPKIIEWIELSPTWQKYIIDLSKYPRDYTKMVGGFGWVADEPIIFFLDDIVYEFDDE